MMIRRTGIPRVTAICFRPIRPIRQYISLPTPYFNVSKTIRIINQQKKHQLRKDNNLDQNADKIFEVVTHNQKLRSKLSQKINEARNFLGKDYILNDELITLCLDSKSTKRVQISSKESEEPSFITIKNFERVGKRLVDLQKTLLILGLELEDKTNNINGLNFDRLEERITEIMHSKNIKTRFIKKTVLPKIITAHHNATMDQKVAIALKTLYTLVGCISFSKGEKTAKKLINEKILRADNGIFELAVKEVNK